MTKGLFFTFLGLLAAVGLAACHPSETTDNGTAMAAAEKAMETNESFEPANDVKLYELLTSQTDQPFPVLFLDTSDETFTFSYDVLSSYLAVGTYRETDEKLELTTDDGKYHYTFGIVDENTLKFLQEESSDIKLIDDKIGYPLEDGDLLVMD